MAVTFVATSSNAVGTTTTAGPATATATLPTGTAVGDRVYVFQYCSNTSDTTPSGWTVLGTKDLVIGSSLGAAASSAGQRYLTVNYQDYDGVWTMPGWSLTSAAQNSNAVNAITLRKSGTWNTPTISGAGEDLTNDTTFSATTPSFTTHTGGFLLVPAIYNIARTTTVETIAQSGATLGTLTERLDAGTGTGNDVGATLLTCSVTAGASAAVTVTGTLSSTGAQGGVVVVEQTETPPLDTGGMFFTAF
jgi:hypothetical protein